MPRDLVVKKDSQNVTIRPFNTPHEYYIITIEDTEGYNHFVYATKPYIYDYWKRHHECQNANIIAREVAYYIWSLYCSDESKTSNDPYTYDFPDGRIVTAYHVNYWLVKSYYPPEVVNAPTLYKKIVGWWYFRYGAALLTHDKSSSLGFIEQNCDKW